MSDYKKELEKWLSSKVPKKLKGNSKKDDFFKEVIQLTEKINNSNKSFRNKGYGNIRDNSLQVLINTLEMDGFSKTDKGNISIKEFKKMYKRGDISYNSLKQIYNQLYNFKWIDPNSRDIKHFEKQVEKNFNENYKDNIKEIFPLLPSKMSTLQKANFMNKIKQAHKDGKIVGSDEYFDYLYETTKEEMVKSILDNIKAEKETLKDLGVDISIRGKKTRKMNRFKA